MNSKVLQTSYGVAVHPSVRCLVGLYGSEANDGLDEAFSALVDDLHNNEEVMNYSLDDVINLDKVQFLVASQSLKPHDSQVTRVTLIESETTGSSHMSKQTFEHPDGEVTGLTALSARPDWFVSTYSSYSSERFERRTGARIWRLPSSINHSFEETGKVTEVGGSPSNYGGRLEYVTTLPLSKYNGIKKIAAYPLAKCADLACLVGPPMDSSSGHTVYTNTGRLVILQAPSDSTSGDYQEAVSIPLCLPSSVSQLFTSHLKSKPPAHWTKVATRSPGLAVPISSTHNAIRWSQAGSSRLAVAFDSGVLGWDVRSMKSCFWLESPHWPCVRDLDFNPHRPEILLTGGDDGCIRLWDLRFLKVEFPSVTDGGSSPGQSGATEPLYTSQSHSHWVWSVRFHPTHDQLILSTGSDCRVSLHSLASYSSDALSDLDNHRLQDSKCDIRSRSLGSDGLSDADNQSISSDGALPEVMVPKEEIPDGLIGRLEQHEDSVYAADWSPVDPWYYASVSYDGNLLISQVPENIKINILL